MVMSRGIKDKRTNVQRHQEAMSKTMGENKSGSLVPVKMDKNTAPKMRGNPIDNSKPGKPKITMGKTTKGKY